MKDLFKGYIKSYSIQEAISSKLIERLIAGMVVVINEGSRKVVETINEVKDGTIVIDNKLVTIDENVRVLLFQYEVGGIIKYAFLKHSQWTHAIKMGWIDKFSETLSANLSYPVRDSVEVATIIPVAKNEVQDYKEELYKKEFDVAAAPSLQDLVKKYPSILTEIKEVGRHSYLAKVEGEKDFTTWFDEQRFFE